MRHKNLDQALHAGVSMYKEALVTLPDKQHQAWCFVIKVFAALVMRLMSVRK